jgi:hypothetical protein
MRAARTSLRRNGPTHAARGGAVIELLLVLPLFLLPFPLFLLDFSRAGVEMGRVHSAARVVAWQEARHTDDATNPSPPDGAVLNTWMFDYGLGGRLLGPAPTVSSSTDDTWSYWGAIGKDASPASSDDTHFDGGAVLSFLMDIGRGFPRFVMGGVGRSGATVTHAGKGFWLRPKPSFTANHYVIGKTAREDDPLDAEGWFDPVKRGWEAIKDAFS